MPLRSLRRALFALVLLLPLAASALDRLPPGDSEDHSQLTTAERLWLRRMDPGIRTSGPYQYPQWAPRLMAWLRGETTQGDGGGARAGGEMTIVGEVDATSSPTPESETTIAVDPTDPMRVVGAANSIKSSGRQAIFSSVDGGATWLAQEFPAIPGKTFHSDPAVAWSSRGEAFSLTLGVSTAGGLSIGLYLTRSSDGGTTWQEPVEIPSSTASNDKELMWIDNRRTSPCRDSIYVVWDDYRTGRILFSRSTDGGHSFLGNPMKLDQDRNGMIGANVTAGSNGEVWVAYQAITDRTLRVATSNDCGASFAAPVEAAKLHQQFDMAVPAQCSRGVLLYPTIDADRSFGCRNGSVYLSWADSTTSGRCSSPCTSDQACTSDVFFTRSTDGGATWSPTVAINEPDPEGATPSDQFFPWLAVDDEDGSIWVGFYDTRQDPSRRLTDYYVTRSTDGGETWLPNVRVSSASSDETGGGADLGNQHGDYSGMAVHGGRAYLCWADRRDGATPDGSEDAWVGVLSAEPGGCFSGQLDGEGPITLE